MSSVAEYKILVQECKALLDSHLLDGSQDLEHTHTHKQMSYVYRIRCN